MPRTHFLPDVFTSTDESVCEENAWAATARASSCCCQSKQLLLPIGLCASHKWRLEFTEACKGLHARHVLCTMCIYLISNYIVHVVHVLKLNIYEGTDFWLIHSTYFTAVATVTLTQTHPAAPYVCRTGNITLRCQYGIAERVLWRIGSMFNLDNLSTITGHTALPPTTTYQDLVVDSYINLRGEYHCTAVFGNGTHAGSNVYVPIAECE